MKEALNNIWNAPASIVESFFSGIALVLSIGVVISLVIAIVIVWQVVATFRRTSREMDQPRDGMFGGR